MVRAVAGIVAVLAVGRRNSGGHFAWFRGGDRLGSTKRGL
ncbi:hypothetical protein LC55x_4200 [Lysobacter capsici]|nr:hypothetical protein LC55x_4200 [Lysobacter capsici]